LSVTPCPVGEETVALTENFMAKRLACVLALPLCVGAVVDILGAESDEVPGDADCPTDSDAELSDRHAAVSDI